MGEELRNYFPNHIVSIYPTFLTFKREKKRKKIEKEGSDT